MPNPQTIRSHGGIKRVRERKIDQNTILRVYTFNDGRTYQETRRVVPKKVRAKKSTAKKTSKRGAYFPR